MGTMNMGINMTIRKECYQFIQNCSLIKGMKSFGDERREAAFKIMQQRHDKEVFTSIKELEVTVIQRRQAMESLHFLVGKKDE